MRIDTNNSNVNINEDKEDIELSSKVFEIEINSTTNMNIETKENKISIETPKIEIKEEDDHSKLQNLDFENSGHTGFQKAGNYVEDKNYVHTDNNFSSEYKNKLDYLFPFIPQTRLSVYVKDKIKYLKIDWEDNELFTKYMTQGRVKLYLYKYTKSGRKRWIDENGKETNKSGIKKWVHPANEFFPNNPLKQCWGIRSFSANSQCETDIDELIENSEYEVANNGLVRTEYMIDGKGLIIPLNDIISPIIKVANIGTEEVVLPTTGDNREVKLMGVKQKVNSGRCNQPIKFCLVIDDSLVGSCLNTAVIQLFKYRTTRDNHDNHGYADCLSILPDIGYSVYIK